MTAHAKISKVDAYMIAPGRVYRHARESCRRQCKPTHDLSNAKRDLLRRITAGFAARRKAVNFPQLRTIPLGFVIKHTTKLRPTGI
jgi:hypothetical protein